MSLRVRGMEHLDPLSVPLPNGTEVTTRVDRAATTSGGEQRIPAGAVGRVVAQRGDTYDVQIVGGAVAGYARGELMPRKAGQLRFAVRRAADWTALRPCVVLEATVGSRAWGLADAGSDTDMRGAFVLPFSWTGGLAELPADLVSSDGSATFWEVEKLVRQALRADPNTLELLFVDGARATDAIGERLLEARDAFVSQQMYGTFGRYALSQLKKLQQSTRLAEHRALVVDWLRADATLSLDALAVRLAAATEIEAPTRADAIERAKEYVKQLYRSMYDQGLLLRSDLAALVEFAGAERAADFALPRELRPKNAYNLLRLIDAAIRWLHSGVPSLRVEGAFRDELLAIKRGEVPLADVLRRAEEMIPALEAARSATALPEQPDVARADALLRRVRQEAARRWLGAEPGPLGRDAPPLPAVSWEDET
jgi:RNA repair pathway DNA polymerase beta family